MLNCYLGFKLCFIFDPDWIMGYFKQFDFTSYKIFHSAIVKSYLSLQMPVFISKMNAISFSYP